MVEADVRVFHWVNGLAGKFAPLDQVIAYAVGDYFLPVALTLLLMALWFSGRGAGERSRLQRAVIYGLVGVGVANLLVLILTNSYFRPRPFLEEETILLFYPPTDSSFPANATAVVFALAYGVWLGNRWLGVGAFALAALLGFARVYTGVHYPLDVLAGAAIGLFITFLASKTIPHLEPIPTLALRLLRRVYLA